MNRVNQPLTVNLDSITILYLKKHAKYKIIHFFSNYDFKKVFKDWMIFKTIYKSNENYVSLSNIKEASDSININMSAKQANSLNVNMYSKAHYINNQNLNLSKTTLSRLSSKKS